MKSLHDLFRPAFLESCSQWLALDVFLLIFGVACNQLWHCISTAVRRGLEILAHTTFKLKPTRWNWVRDIIKVVRNYGKKRWRLTASRIAGVDIFPCFFCAIMALNSFEHPIMLICCGERGVRECVHHFGTKPIDWKLSTNLRSAWPAFQRW